MSVERGTCRDMLKIEIFYFFVKKIFSKKFEHTIRTGLKNSTTGESFVEYAQGVVQIRRIFV
jgi:hypothetical protein